MVKTVQRDLDILEVIIIKINKYFNNFLHINTVINDLDSLLTQLTTIDEKWKLEFRTLWSNMEIAYALTLDQGLETFDNQRKKITEKSLFDLKKMTEVKIKELKEQLSSEEKDELAKPIPEIQEKANDLGDNWLMCPLCQEAWENHSKYGMVRCPNCNHKLHNPKH